MKKYPTYSDFEKQFPEYIIIQKERFMYTTHGRSAEAFGFFMDYKVVKSNDGQAFTGGPDPDKICQVLKGQNISFILIEDHRIVDGHSGENPFEKPMRFSFGRKDHIICK